jgi:choline-sulfatase
MAGEARNLLFLFSDQHARRVAGCYGETTVSTPNLDRLAAEGCAFDAAYCPSPICVPSRMAMLSARRPHRTGCWTNDDMLPARHPCWPHALGAAGKRPILAGRLHAMGPDQLHGYAERLVGEHSPNWAGPPRHDLGALAGTNDPDPRSLALSGPGRTAYMAKDDAVVQAALRWIEANAAREAAGAGFALTVGLMLPHAPYVADPETFALYDGRTPPPRLPPPPDEHPFHAWWRRDRAIRDVEMRDVMRARAAYWALTHRMDRMIGRLLDALERLRLLDETLVVYASDHGDHVGERGLWWKHTFYEESVGVPLLMRLPGVLPAGARRAEVVDLMDLAATMLEATGAPALPHADGRSFWRLACGEAQRWRNETFSEYCTDAVPYWTGGRALTQRMARIGARKLVSYDREPPQLFDLDADPDERRDLARDPSHASVRDAMLARVLDGWNHADVAARMAAARDEKDLIAAWARNTHPASTHVWAFDPAINGLS